MIDPDEEHDPTALHPDRDIGLAATPARSNPPAHVTVDSEPLCYIAGETEPVEELPDAGYCAICEKLTRLMNIDLPAEPEGSA